MPLPDLGPSSKLGSNLRSRVDLPHNLRVFRLPLWIRVSSFYRLGAKASYVLVLPTLLCLLRQHQSLFLGSFPVPATGAARFALLASPLVLLASAPRITLFSRVGVLSHCSLPRTRAVLHAERAPQALCSLPWCPFSILPATAPEAPCGDPRTGCSPGSPWKRGLRCCSKRWTPPHRPRRRSAYALAPGRRGP